MTPNTPPSPSTQLSFRAKRSEAEESRHQQLQSLNYTSPISCSCAGGSQYPTHTQPKLPLNQLSFRAKRSEAEESRRQPPNPSTNPKPPNTPSRSDIHPIAPNPPILLPSQLPIRPPNQQPRLPFNKTSFSPEKFLKQKQLPKSHFRAQIAPRNPAFVSQINSPPRLNSHPLFNCFLRLPITNSRVNPAPNPNLTNATPNEHPPRLPQE